MTSTERPISGRSLFLAKNLSLTKHRKWLTGALAALGVLVLSAPQASAETRSLKLIQLHTGEKGEIVFKRNGRYDQAGLKKINYLLRDWRKNQPTTMNPRLLDLIWEAYRQSGATGYINVVCGYRSPGTNAMLKARSRKSGVAEKSQHMLGNAMDFFIPGVKLKRLREIGLKMQGGGVGYYPTSGSPFVHFDVGNVRHWPKMSRQELVALFPNGKTLHVPSDGKPLPGFEQALASYKSRKTAGELAIASATGGGGAKKSGFFARLFGGGADEAEDEGSIEVAAEEAAPKAPARAAKAAARKAPAEAQIAQVAKPIPGIQIVPPSEATPAEMPREEDDSPATVIAALSPRSIPLPVAAPRAPESRPEDAPQIAEAVNDTLTEIAAATPATLPEKAPAELDASVPATIAANVPLPTWRPMDEAPVTVAAAIADDQAAKDKNEQDSQTAVVTDADAAVLTALAESSATREKAADLLAPLPSARPMSPGIAALASVMAPRAETAPEQQVASAGSILPLEASAEMPLTALAGREAETGARSEAALALAKADAKRKRIELASIKADDKRLALASTFAGLPSGSPAAQPAESPRRLAMAGGKGGGKGDRRLAAALFSQVKTTDKAARPSRRDLKPEAKPVPVAAEPAAARWAIYGDKVATVTEGTTAPSFAHNLVRSAPREVYTAGFQQASIQADAHRFTGKAVTFLGVARFETN